MRHGILIALLLVGCWLGSIALACPAHSASYTGQQGQQSVSKARAELRAAHRAAVRAARRESEARARLRATIRYTELYGAAVGRWVRLGRIAGWTWVDFPTLMRIVKAESGGDPNALNASSGCAGLLQLHPCWWTGLGDPYCPAYNLRRGLYVRRQAGWGSWTTY